MNFNGPILSDALKKEAFYKNKQKNKNTKNKLTKTPKN